MDIRKKFLVVKTQFGPKEVAKKGGRFFPPSSRGSTAGDVLRGLD